MVDYSKWDNLDVSDDSDAETSSHHQQSNRAVQSVLAQQQPQPPSSGTFQTALTTTTTDNNNNKHPDPLTSEHVSDQEQESRLPPALQEYANISPTTTPYYKASRDFLYHHPSLIDKATNSDGLLMKEAFIMALDLQDLDSPQHEPADQPAQSQADRDEIAALVKQCVHQALLLQYCRMVSADGTDQAAVGGFFGRLAAEGGEGEVNGKQRALFEADVETRTGEILALAREARGEQLRGLKEKKREDGDGGEGVGGK